jgi:hypothetical protein
VELNALDPTSGVLQRIPAGAIIKITERDFNDGMVEIEWRDRRFSAFAIDLRERSRCVEPSFPKLSATG